MNKTIILNERPNGKPQLDNFKIKLEENPSTVLKVNEILLKTKYVSVDPYLRGRMSNLKSYIEPFQIGKPMSSGVIAKVIQSNNENFQEGEFVSGMLEWKELQVSNVQNLQKVNPKKATLSAYLGVLGMTGVTAFMGLTEIGKPKKGETLVVSGAAGAVGSIVGQIGKLLGCRVVGIAGTDQKVKFLKKEFGFDEVINYNTTNNIEDAIQKACPDGVDIYFDNVGGTISDGVKANLNHFARIIMCGAISLYNETTPPVGPRIDTLIIKKSILMQGFIVSNYLSKFPEAIKQLSTWLEEGKLNYNETIIEGFENIPEAFIALFEGKNTGKMIVKI